LAVSLTLQYASCVGVYFSILLRLLLLQFFSGLGLISPVRGPTANLKNLTMWVTLAKMTTEVLGSQAKFSTT